MKMRIPRLRTATRLDPQQSDKPWQRVLFASSQDIERGTVVMQVSSGRVQAWIGPVLRVRRDHAGNITHVWTRSVWCRHCKRGAPWRSRNGQHTARRTILDALAEAKAYQ